MNSGEGEENPLYCALDGTRWGPDVATDDKAQTKVVAQLLRAKADPNLARSKTGRGALQIALEVENTQHRHVLLGLLLSAGADPNAAAEPTKPSHLQVAVDLLDERATMRVAFSNPCKVTWPMLLQAGADPYKAQTKVALFKYHLPGVPRLICERLVRSGTWTNDNEKPIHSWR